MNKHIVSKLTLSLMLYISSSIPMHSIGIDLDTDISREIDRIQNSIESKFRSFWGDDEQTLTTQKQKNKSQSKSFSSLWSQAQQELRSAAKALEATADTMSSSSVKARVGSFVDSLATYGKQALQQIRDTEKKLRDLRLDIQARIRSSQQVQTYDIKEDSSKDKYNIIVTLPGFKQEDIKVIIENADTRSELKKLKINAFKRESIQLEEKHDSKKSNWSSHSFSSMRYVNGRKAIIDYQDGTLNITLDLPENINDQDYTMRIEANNLIVSFPQAHQVGTKTRQLKFNTKKHTRITEQPDAWK